MRNLHVAAQSLLSSLLHGVPLSAVRMLQLSAVSSHLLLQPQQSVNKAPMHFQTAGAAVMVQSLGSIVFFYHVDHHIRLHSVRFIATVARYPHRCLVLLDNPHGVFTPFLLVLHRPRVTVATESAESPFTLFLQQRTQK